MSETYVREIMNSDHRVRSQSTDFRRRGSFGNMSRDAAAYNVASRLYDILRKVRYIFYCANADESRNPTSSGRNKGHDSTSA